MRKINLIVIHCSATRCNQRYSIDSLRADHNARFHNKGIGYHYYIERDGQLHKPRDESEVGMHALHYNAHSIGICYEGGLDEKGRSCEYTHPSPACHHARPTPLSQVRLSRCRNQGPL